MAEWTKDELLLANEQVLAATETRLKKGSALEAAYEATEDVAIEFACQRNLLLERFKELHNAGGQVWIEDLIHRIEPEWKSYWTLLAEEDARECALANEDGCPTGEHARTEEK